MAFEGKVYVHDRDENFEGFVATLGLSEDNVQKLKNSKPKYKLEKNGDTYTATTFSDKYNRVVTFKLNEEFDEAVVDGRNVSIYTHRKRIFPLIPTNPHFLPILTFIRKGWEED
ncbi:Fatty acid-binding protein 2 [Papilio machaon]|uniref:Fatty acid-binding protein 2 n=1 Tax=Papilio machaon TaxID=76193 RepID=A0A0N1IIC1_PAPMA|nr:Fatty acid-binding protein 2 [Papilio machaon]